MLAQALETLRSGLYVVTSQKDGELAGCTAVWVSRVSFNPPLLAVTLAPTRHTYKVIEKSRRFCINVLGESSLDVARRFGFNTGDSGKFEHVQYHVSESEMPVLDQAVAWFDCTVASILETGDHRVLIGEVQASARQGNEKPAVYIAESFYADAPALAKAGSSVE